MGLGVGLMIAATAVTGYTTYQSGQIQKKTAKYNAHIARQMAEDAKRRGEQKEYIHRQRVAALVGRQRALIGSSGVAVDEGSTMDIVADTYAMGELDALTIRNNAMREAWGQEALAVGFGFEEELGQMQATWGTGATVLGGASKVVVMRSAMKNP